MIRVNQAPEPPGFREDVTVPGRKLVEEALGQGQDVKSSELKPLWRAYLPHLHEAYNGVCAYVCIYIHPVTGARTADHSIAKSTDPSRAYDWDNLRLACSLMNSRKGAFEDVLDPFEVGDNWFVLDPSTYAIRPACHLSAETAERVQATIDKLKLGGDEGRYQDENVRREHRKVRDARSDYGDAFLAGEISATRLMKECPFVAKEFARQGIAPVLQHP